MTKKKVHFVSAPCGVFDKGQIFGGSVMTVYTIKKAFQDSKKYDLIMRDRASFSSTEELFVFLKEGDIGWLDESHLTQLLFGYNFTAPDIVGPICRSPVKNYNQGQWDSFYTPDWFYRSTILRLNENEEKEVSLKQEFKGKDFLKNVNYIRHAIDLEKFKPVGDKKKKYILWAGQMNRDAKNFPMFKEIVKQIDLKGGLPKGYEFKIMSGYAIEEYIAALQDAAIVVNTSKYESFCGALGEAMACGVACILPKKLNGNIMYLDRPTQVEYNAKAYADEILKILQKKKVEKLGKEALLWVKENCSTKVMREDIEKVFDKVLEKKK